MSARTKKAKRIVCGWCHASGTPDDPPHTHGTVRLPCPQRFKGAALDAAIFARRDEEIQLQDALKRCRERLAFLEDARKDEA